MASMWGTVPGRKTLDEQIRKLFKEAWSGPNGMQVQEEWSWFREKVTRTIDDLKVIATMIERADISKKERALPRRDWTRSQSQSDLQVSKVDSR